MRIKIIFITLLSPLIFLSCGNGSDIEISQLKLNNEINPIGIDTEVPVFSWKLFSKSKNRCQTAYQLIVLSETTKDTCWNSGNVQSDNNIQVKYSGKKINVGTSYQWKVRIVDNTGKWSKWSDENYFSTGLQSEKDWQAQWITSPDSVYSPYFVKEFTLDKKSVKAVAYVNCQGYYELYINGKKVGKDVLSPAVSDFRYENYYLTYDIAPFLESGKNTIGIWTGRGWYSPGLPGVLNQAPVFRCQVHLSSTDKNIVIASDTTWRTSGSNIKQIGAWRWNKMGGELIDGRICMAGWCKEKVGMKKAVQGKTTSAITKSQICRTNQITEKVVVEKITEIEKDVWLVDFGKNFVGWMEIKIKDQQSGDTINFVYSDFCNQSPKRLSKTKWDFGNKYINQEDAFICSGKTGDVFCPKFNYHAFRYAIIGGLKNKPDNGDISGFTIEANHSSTGTFSSSDKDLNAIHELNKFTFRCLSIGGYYVDCPHRERLGYGDGQVAVETGIYNFDLYSFYKKWAQNWLNTQDSTGNIAHTAPSPYSAGGGPAWGGTGVVLPWKIYQYYGDSTFLNSSYNSMVRYVGFLETKSKDGLLEHYGDKTWGFIGDWLPPGKGMDTKNWGGKIEKELFNNCYKLYLYDILAKSAKVLGKVVDENEFRTNAEILKTKINQKYYDTEKGIYATGEQSYLSFPLLMKVPAEMEAASVFKNLEHEIKVVNEGHINTGMLGTYFMLQYLTETGRSDLIYLMMKQKTYPGWGYMIAQGANTCWEQWNGYWSNIHSCFTSGGGWFYSGVAGIRQTENSVAFKHLLIAPQLTKEIQRQKTEFESPYGKVMVQWDNKNGALQLTLEIPVNTKADVLLPVSTDEIVYESGKNINETKDIELLSREGSNLRLLVNSGKYIFEIRKAH
jgi:alpha-L-rhamnosidase